METANDRNEVNPSVCIPKDCFDVIACHQLPDHTKPVACALDCKGDRNTMPTRCDECNAEIVVPTIATVKQVAFNFCSPQCRDEFASFTKSRGHIIVSTKRPVESETQAEELAPQFLESGNGHLKPFEPLQATPLEITLCP